MTDRDFEKLVKELVLKQVGKEVAVLKADIKELRQQNSDIKHIIDAMGSITDSHLDEMKLKYEDLKIMISKFQAQIPRFQTQIDEHLTNICEIEEIKGSFRQKLERNRLLKSQRA